MGRAVGQFKELVESAEKDQPLQESLRKALNLTAKGWEGARKHALRAVTTDNRMRIWTADDSLSTGLLFRCNLGRILMDAPVGGAPHAPVIQLHDYTSSQLLGIMC